MIKKQKKSKSSETCQSSAWGRLKLRVQRGSDGGLTVFGKSSRSFCPQARRLFSFICSFYHPYFSCLQIWSDRHHWDYQHARDHKHRSLRELCVCVCVCQSDSVCVLISVSLYIYIYGCPTINSWFSRRPSPQASLYTQLLHVFIITRKQLLFFFSAFSCPPNKINKYRSCYFSALFSFPWLTGKKWKLLRPVLCFWFNINDTFNERDSSETLTFSRTPLFYIL